MEQAVKNVLQAMEDIAPSRFAAKEKNRSEKRRHRWGCYGLVIGFLALSIWAIRAWTVKASLIGTAAWDWIRNGVFLFLLLWLVTQAAVYWPNFQSLRAEFRILDYERLRMISELEHDLRNAGRLMAFTQNDLTSTDEWLQVVIERRKAIVARYMGTVDKLALFSLIAMAWSIFDALRDLHQLFPAGSMYFWMALFVMVICIALLVGLAIGALLTSYAVARYSYHRDIIMLAVCAQRTSS